MAVATSASAESIHDCEDQQMRRLTQTELAIAMLQIGAARAKNEAVSEFESARVHIDFILSDLVAAIQSGMSRADAISIVAVYAQVSRRVAGDILCKRLRQAGLNELNERPKPAKSEVSKEILVKREANTVTPVAAAPVSAPRPVQPVVTAKPVPRPAQAPTSASTESNQVPSKKLVLDFSKMPGANSFLGEPGYGPSQEEKELRAKAQANLDRMEREHGSPLDQARKINQQGEAK